MAKIRKAVILAAGMGTRFLPATKATPKEMLPVVDRPAIQFLVEEAAGAGIREILIVTGRGKRSIEDHFDRSIELEHRLEQAKDYEALREVRSIVSLARIHYVRQSEPLGTGHAVLQAEGFVDDEPFIVMMGDDLIIDNSFALQAMIDWAEANDNPVVALERLPQSELSSYGCVKEQILSPIEQRFVGILRIVEKPRSNEAPSNLGIIGRYIFQPGIFPILRATPRGVGDEILLTDAMAKLEKLYGYILSPSSSRRFDIGQRLNYLKTVVTLAVERSDIGREFRAFLNEFVKEYPFVLDSH